MAERWGGVSSEAVEKATGKSWAEWLAALDEAGAKKLDHRGIVALVAGTSGAGPWWRQMIAVGYEQARGLREKHETTSGYQVGVSKTFPVGVNALWDAWEDAATRRRWLGAVAFTVRKATRAKSMRITWGDGSHVDAMFHARGEKKCMVQVDQRKLPGRAAVERARAFWRARLEKLGRMLGA
jgi:hypothetical protein